MSSNGGELPLACSLTMAQGAARRTRWLELAERSLLETSATEGGVRLSYAAAPAMVAELEALAALERECCAWASWTVSDNGDVAVLEVTADDLDAASAVRVMFGAGPPT